MKRTLALFLALLMALALVPTAAFAATSEASGAAQALYDLGLFQGTGSNADGTPNFDLDRTPTRAEAVTMLVRLLGKDAEAKAGTWETPFTDVADWAKPYVGYAYANGLTTGTSDTTFGGEDPINATQYTTFLLRALGYTSGTDFQWDEAWKKAGQAIRDFYQTSDFTRGDVARYSYCALRSYKKGTPHLLGESLNNPAFKYKGASASELQGIWYYEDDVNGNGIVRRELIIEENTVTYMASGGNTLTRYQSGPIATTESGEIQWTSSEDYYELRNGTVVHDVETQNQAVLVLSKPLMNGNILNDKFKKVDTSKLYATCHALVDKGLSWDERNEIIEQLNKMNEGLNTALQLAKNAGAVGLNSIILGMGVSSPYKTEKERAEVEAVAKGNVTGVKSASTAIWIGATRLREIFEKIPDAGLLVAKLVELEDICLSIKDTPVSLDSDTLTEMLNNLTTATDLFVEIRDTISNKYRIS